MLRPMQLKRKFNSAGRLRAWSAVAIVGLSFLLQGCAWKGSVPQAAANGHIADPWQPRPVQMRVYPSSRFVNDGQGSLLEARIELLDDMGDSVKGSGTVQIELLAAGEARQSESNRRLYSWRADVLTLEQQKQHFDPITRAYLFRLKMDRAPDPQQRTVLWATFTPVQGDRLEARAGMDEVLVP